MKPFSQLLIFIALTLNACVPLSEKHTGSPQNVSIAFMPDIHFHDIYSDFSDRAFPGLPTETSTGNDNATIRSMRAQLNSTRLFNENYFALLAALDDIVARKIKYVALPGDFSDDGQPLHIRGLKKILDYYHHEHGLEFFSAPGNHDPVRPFSRPAGKRDYLGEHGKEQPIFSHQHPACISPPETPDIHAVICSDEVMEWGYEPIMNMLSAHGFFPKQKYHYFETPFSQYGYDEYDYTIANKEASFALRQYEVCQQGAGGKQKPQHYRDCYTVPDSSYLVEPAPGIWLLAIDANVYQPVQSGSGDNKDANNFHGSGNAGYNKVITHKTHLIPWITSVVERAKQHNKTLIAFSHFPMQEFYDGASEDIAQLFGDDKLQMARKPNNHTSQLLAATGLRIHVAGHMHINDTGVINSEDGNTLFNIQAPSLAAYVPAYKVLTLKGNQKIEVETVVLKNVPRFNELFPHYLAEWNHLHAEKAPQIWDKKILDSQHYYEFTEWHLRELSRLRFLPQEWPADVRELLGAMTGRDLLTLSQLEETPDLQHLKLLPLGGTVDSQLVQDPALVKAWNRAQDQAAALVKQHGFSLSDFDSWNGHDIGVDFYRLFNADQLALRDISASRLEHYHLLAQQLTKAEIPNTKVTAMMEMTKIKSFKENADALDQYRHRLQKVLQILLQFTGGAPSDHFMLDLESGTITPLS